MKLDINSIIKTIGASVSFEISDRLEELDSGIGTVTFTGPVAVKGTTCFNRMIEVREKRRSVQDILRPLRRSPRTPSHRSIR